MTFTLSPDQQAAVDRITNWFMTVRREVTFCTGGEQSGDGQDDGDTGSGCTSTPHTHVIDPMGGDEPGDGPCISLGGLAGTGKTSVTRYLGEQLTAAGVRLLFAAPTNKAAGVLRKKLPEDMRNLVMTTYALSYFPDPKDKCKTSNAFVKEIETSCTCGNSAEDCTCARVFEPCGFHDDPCRIFEHLDWVKRKYVRGHAELLIVDESSMLSQDQVEDILAFGLPVVLVGDHGQLPPVMAQMNRWIAKPDIVLTENHRQKNDTSGIVDLALWAREGMQLKKGVWGDGRTVVVAKDDPRTGKLLDADRYRARNADVGSWPQIICATNDVRSVVNRQMHGEGPVRAGDKVIALRKCVVPVVERFDPDGRPVPRMKALRAVNTATGQVEATGELEEVRWTVHNGAMGVVVRAWEPRGGLVRMIVRLDDPQGLMVEVSGCEEKQFGRGTVLARNEVTTRESRLWDYAYAITAHKAQGSEWDDVVVLDNAMGDKERWRYTAITRARRKLIVVTMKD